MITENTIWISNINPENEHGHPIKKLNNNHIANILHFFKVYGRERHGHPEEERAKILASMTVEASKRGLTQQFLNGAPYPYDPSAPYEEYKGPRGGFQVTVVNTLKKLNVLK